MQKILFLANLNPNKFGSIEEHAVVLCEEITRRGGEFFVGFVIEPVLEIRSRFEAAGAKILRVYCGDTPLIGNNTRFNFGEMWSLYRTIQRNKIDIVHLNFVGPTNPSLLGIYLSRARIVFTEHASGFPLYRNPLKYLISRTLHFFIACRVSKYIGVSEYVTRRLKNSHHVSGEKTLTIYNGVNLQRFKPSDPQQARQELGVSGVGHILCAVAMLIPEKGIHNLLRAVAQIADDGRKTDILLLIAGEGYYRQELERLAAELSIEQNVMFLGRRSDVQTIIAASDIVIVPSVWEEAFGLIVAEAMAGARPVVASETGGIPELVEHGKTGILVEPGNVDELASALRQLIDSPESCRRMGEVALIKASREFDLDRQVQKLVELYDRQR